MAPEFDANRMLDLLEAMEAARDATWSVAAETGDASHETFRAKLRYADAVVKCAGYLHWHLGEDAVWRHVGRCADAWARAFSVAHCNAVR